jgi:hypothetical protein
MKSCLYTCFVEIYCIQCWILRCGSCFVYFVFPIFTVFDKIFVVISLSIEHASVDDETKHSLVMWLQLDQHSAVSVLRTRVVQRDMLLR